MALMATAGAIVLAVIAWRLTPRLATAEVPTVPTNGLESFAIDLISRHRQAVQSQPRSGAAWGRLGGVLKSFNFRHQAAYCLSEAERLEPAEPRWPYLLGSLHAATSVPRAIERFRRAVALCGNEPEMPRLRLAQLLAESGHEAEAQAELEPLLAAKPDCAPARLLEAQLRYARGDSERALALAKRCTTNASTARAAWTLLAALHRRRGETNASEMANRRAQAVTADVAWPDPFEDETLALRNDARSLSDRAQNFLLAGRIAEAVPLVQRLSTEHPHFAETWLLLGRTQYLQRQPAAAERSLRLYLEKEPASVNGHFQLGMSLLAQQRYPEAAASFRQAVALKRDFGPAYFNLGFALARAGQPREAVPAFREAIRHNPEVIDSYILLADLHLQLGEKEDAGALARLAEGINPADARLPVLHRKIRGEL